MKFIIVGARKVTFWANDLTEPGGFIIYLFFLCVPSWWIMHSPEKLFLWHLGIVLEILCHHLLCLQCLWRPGGVIYYHKGIFLLLCLQDVCCSQQREHQVIPGLPLSPPFCFPHSLLSSKVVKVLVYFGLASSFNPPQTQVRNTTGKTLQGPWHTFSVKQTLVLMTLDTSFL